jgi:hypothetical protein
MAHASLIRGIGCGPGHGHEEHARARTGHDARVARHPPLWICLEGNHSFDVNTAQSMTGIGISCLIT